MSNNDEVIQAEKAAEEVEEQISETEETIDELKQDLKKETDEEQKTWIRNEIQAMKGLITELKELLKAQQKTIRDLARQSIKNSESKNQRPASSTPTPLPESTPPDASEPPQQNQAVKPKAREWI